MINRKAVKYVSIYSLLFFYAVFSSNQIFAHKTFDQAYAQIFNYNLSQARQTLQHPFNLSHDKALKIYLLSLTDLVELLVSEDITKYEIWKEIAALREKQLEDLNYTHKQYYQAELALHRAFVKLRFREEWAAALQLNKAYRLIKKHQSDYPDHIPQLKTIGILNLIIGMVPEQYNWALQLIGMEGDIDHGLNCIAKFSQTQHDQVSEANWLMIMGSWLTSKNKTKALLQLETLHESYSSSPLLELLLAMLQSKMHQAPTLLSDFEAKRDSDVIIPYIFYIMGQTYFQGGFYHKAINAYTQFINLYKGSTHIKDAHYKVGLCYWFLRNKTKMLNHFATAKKNGNTYHEADKHAARQLEALQLPHLMLTKIRYATDGGFFETAAKLFTQINIDSLNKIDLAHFHYRKARFHHLQHHNTTALSYYKKTIEKAPMNAYFGANACLQLAYIYMDLGDKVSANFYLKKVRTYQGYEYENSIKSKAKLAQNKIKSNK